jgi:hypothetical protein
MTGKRSAAIIETSELLHFSLIKYSIPAERTRGILPPEFELSAGQAAFLSITSYIDAGIRLAGGGRRDAFEQTNYRLHFRESGNWLIGTSLGSLTAVAQRHYWSRPWHLSAMEFQVSFDGQHYRDYRLQTQSQWANSYWVIEDSGEMRDRDPIESRTWDYYYRRDGHIGVSRTAYYDLYGTAGRLRAARCDLLTRLGLLTERELMCPAQVTLQSSVRVGVGASYKGGEVNLFKSAADAAVSAIMAP